MDFTKADRDMHSKVQEWMSQAAKTRKAKEKTTRWHAVVSTFVLVLTFILMKDAAVAFESENAIKVTGAEEVNPFNSLSDTVIDTLPVMEEYAKEGDVTLADINNEAQENTEENISLDQSESEFVSEENYTENEGDITSDNVDSEYVSNDNYSDESVIYDQGDVNVNSEGGSDMNSGDMGVNTDVPADGGTYDINNDSLGNADDAASYEGYEINENDITALGEENND